MEVFKEIAELRKSLKSYRLQQLSVGLVPTMGYLHEGHLDLIRSSTNQNDITVCSIFVNPVQFNNPQDLSSYPQSISEDLDKLNDNGVSIVFMPSISEMYSQRAETVINFGKKGEIMEGKFRPDHFNGVGLVVSKLFNIVQPDKAYFGQKDLQQLVLIKLMVKDLSFDIKIEVVPTKRESDGLAMSSRNARLNADELIIASMMYKTLKKGEEMLLNNFSIEEVLYKADVFFKSNKGINLEYFNVVDLNTFKILDSGQPDDTVALCVAANVGGVRLIDNIICDNTGSGEN